MSVNFYNATKDAEVVSGAMNFSSLVMSDFASYGLTNAQATAFAALAGNLNTKYQQSIEPSTRTPVTIQGKNDAKQAMKENAISLARIIVANPAVTNEQLVALGLLPRTSPSPVPAPSEAPGIDLRSVVGRTVTVRIHDADSPTKRGKAPGTAAAFVYTFVGANYPSDPSLWDFQGSTSRSKFEITFPNDLAGGTQVWICAAWVNAKQETGPVSAPITTNLQGGGSSSEEGELKIAA